MCGICGIWHQPDMAAIDRMVAALRHRGPDDQGVFGDELVGLGMSRLAIIDLNPTGHQPMASSDENIWIIYNGETYNFQHERSGLERLGYQFKSSSDTEVILRLYEHYGDDFLLRMRGMFALAIYDRRKGAGKERLLLARDQMGIKPLLYAQCGNRFVFASEIKALLAARLIEPEIDPESLRLLLTYGSVFQPRTILRGVKILLPAHRLILENGQERLERYWSAGTYRQPDLARLPYLEQVDALDAALNESVRLQMISDVPLGAFLSGGVDSSILVAMMSRQSRRKIKTFSVGFEAEGAPIDESGIARSTADYLATDHTHVLVTGSDVRAQLGRLPEALDQPSVDGVNSFFVSMAARQGMTVAVSGTGGDELFAGYPWFLNMVHHPWLKRQDIKKEFVKAMAEAAENSAFDGLMRTPLGNKLLALRYRGGFLAQYAQQYQIFGSRGTARLLSREMRGQSRSGRAEGLDVADFDELKEGSILQRVSALCLRGYTTNQLLRDIDAVSMSHSLEVRVPYLDHILFDLALSLPDTAKIGEPTGSNHQDVGYQQSGAKRILIDVGKKYLPAGFGDQPKRGFAMPFDAWLKGPLSAELEESLSPERVQERGWFNPAEVTRVKEQFLSGAISWPQPWLLMITELWAERYLS